MRMKILLCQFYHALTATNGPVLGVSLLQGQQMECRVFFLLESFPFPRLYACREECCASGSLLAERERKFPPYSQVVPRVIRHLH